MHPTYQAHSPHGPPSSPSQQNKVILQREYREKEGESFDTLRGIIKGLTGEELRTRQEILRKAIGILSTAPEIRQQPSEAQADTTLQPFPTEPVHVDAFTQSSYCPQSWQSSAEFGAALSDYSAPVHDQQYHFMSGIDPAFNPASSPGYGQDPSGYPRS